MRDEVFNELMEFIVKIDDEMADQERLARWTVTHAKEGGWTIRLVVNNEVIGGSAEDLHECLRALGRNLKTKPIQQEN